MKAMVRLTLAVVLLAGAVALPSIAGAAAPAGPSACEQFCWTVRCGWQQSCGLYTDASGQLACGCHGPKVILE
ncbi:MAG TPA: hypothetical protein VHN15_08890 [Thermoanaerobaculia bacterium]|nr:hypothetical protein [Thermoanaerobaculia bacterium]